MCSPATVEIGVGAPVRGHNMHLCGHGLGKKVGDGEMHSCDHGLRARRSAMVERIHVAMGLEQEQHQVADSIAPRDISATGWRQNYGVTKTRVTPINLPTELVLHDSTQFGRNKI